MSESYLAVVTQKIYNILLLPKRPIFVMVSKGDRRLTMSLVDPYYYGTISAIN